MATTTTKRDKPIISHESFMYRFDKHSADDGKFWRLKDGCHGRIKTEATDVFIEYRNLAHSHAAVPEEATVCQIITTMKNRAEMETGSVAQVYHEKTAALLNQMTTATAMPTFQDVIIVSYR